MARRAVFLDRDGTIIVEKNYLSDPERVTLEVGAAAGMRRMAAAGYVLVVLSNQSGVARGYFSRDQVDRVNRRVAELLLAEKVNVARWYVCYHGPNDDCACRKPRPGLALQAIEALGLDASESWVVGDKMSDVDLATAIGARSILVTSGYGSGVAESLRGEVIVCGGLDSAADVILSRVDKRVQR